MSNYLKSSPNKGLIRQDILVLVCTAFFSCGVYLSWSYFSFRTGFPLDDAWIHLTYARNLALHGEWAFLPGQLSAGSTAPLWTLLLSVGFFLNLAPYLWTYFLGFVFLLGISILAEQILRQTQPAYTPAYPWIGCIFLLEWHLVWAAFSGMETILYIFILFFVMYLVLTNSRNYILAGILIGVSLWVRPDGLTLLGLMFVIIAMSESTFTARWRCIWRLGLGFGGFFLPYLLFNLILTGTPMPNTFYAKQTEYVAWQVNPFTEKSIYFLLQFFQGISILLVPFFFRKMIFSVKRNDWRMLALMAWVIGYCWLYVSRLPVYQHGRYLMPAMAVFFLIGFSGFFEKAAIFLNSIITNGLKIFSVSILLLSFVFGGYTYAQDVALIESQMVESALWISKNLNGGEEIAAHDIGALGYFGQHPIVDLAGLINADIVPIMLDDELVAAYLNKHAVRYLVAFSGWRPALTDRGEQIYNANNDQFLQGQAGSMAVYRWILP